MSSGRKYNIVAKSEQIAIGHNIKRLDAVAKVTGEAVYPGDIDLPHQLWMKIKFSDRAHARIISMDASEAEALDGVVDIYLPDLKYADEEPARRLSRAPARRPACASSISR